MTSVMEPPTLPPLPSLPVPHHSSSAPSLPGLGQVDFVPDLQASHASVVGSEDPGKAPSSVRLYPSHHRVSMTRYATSTDPRGYIPVYEYTIAAVNNPATLHTIMIDCESGMVHFTGIWKALGHTKADVVKLIESDPTIAMAIKKVRGGYLKIQGTWAPYDTALTLARRVAYQIRYDLVPLFGPGFPDSCLTPGQPGYGQLLLSAPKIRGSASRRHIAQNYRPAPPLLPQQQQPYSFSNNGPQRLTGYERFAPYPSQHQHQQHQQSAQQLPPPQPQQQSQYSQQYANSQFHMAPPPPPTSQQWTSTHPSATYRQPWGSNTSGQASPSLGGPAGPGMPSYPPPASYPQPMPAPPGESQSAQRQHQRSWSMSTDQDAIASLMSMAVQTPTFTWTPTASPHGAGPATPMQGHERRTPPGTLQPSGSYHQHGVDPSVPRSPLASAPAPSTTASSYHDHFLPAPPAPPPGMGLPPLNALSGGSSTSLGYSPRWASSFGGGLTPSPPFGSGGSHFLTPLTNESNIRSGSAEPASTEKDGDRDAQEPRGEEVARPLSAPPFSPRLQELPLHASEGGKTSSEPPRHDKDDDATDGPPHFDGDGLDQQVPNETDVHTGAAQVADAIAAPAPTTPPVVHTSPTDVHTTA